MIRRRDIIACGLAMAALAACGPADAPRSSRRELRIAIGGQPAFDPHKAYRHHDAIVCQALFKGLVTFDAAGGLMPGLARSWNVSADGLTYTFRMRKAAWSDGRPITAGDWVSSFKRAFAPRTGNRLAQGLLALQAASNPASGGRPPFSAVALTGDVLQLSLANPMPALLGLLAHPALALAPMHAIRRHGKGWTDPDVLVVSGAFKPAALGGQGRIELVRNPGYYAADGVMLDRVFLLPAQDDDATFAGFRDGKLDIVTGDAFPARHFDVLRQEMAAAVRAEPGWAVATFLVNDRQPPFHDPVIRRALSMAIDRQLLVETLQLGAGVTPTAAVVPGNLPSYGQAVEPDWWSWPRDQRQGEAERLLRQAGYSSANPLEVTVIQEPGEIDRRIFAAVAQQWARAGIRARALIKQPDDLNADLAAGRFELASQRVPLAVDMPEASLARLLCDVRQTNQSGYCNPEADRLFADAIKLADVAARSGLLKRAEALVVAETPLISLFRDVNRSLVRPGITGWTDNPTGLHAIEALSLETAG